jgi:hypothetical protein
MVLVASRIWNTNSVVVTNYLTPQSRSLPSFHRDHPMFFVPQSIDSTRIVFRKTKKNILLCNHTTGHVVNSTILHVFLLIDLVDSFYRLRCPSIDNAYYMVRLTYRTFCYFKSAIISAKYSVAFIFYPLTNLVASIFDATRTAISCALISVTLIALFDTPIVPRSCTSR